MEYALGGRKIEKEHGKWMVYVRMCKQGVIRVYK